VKTKLNTIIAVTALPVAVLGATPLGPRRRRGSSCRTTRSARGSWRRRPGDQGDKGETGAAGPPGIRAAEWPRHVFVSVVRHELARRREKHRQPVARTTADGVCASVG